MAKYNKTLQVKEIIKCGKDPNYFFKNYLKIQHPVKGLIPFETYEFQDKCIGDFLENRFNQELMNRITNEMKQFILGYLNVLQQRRESMSTGMNLQTSF